ncbi:putative integral membrane protein [Leishmania donovani]|uniref:Putative integral membrane protein n=1 Tax=Leishmania donovani TaxID=5661 RepID=A0A504XWQ2_LEIDO|nr:putative integral membrane protein [Leishmania donovani]
MDNYSATGFDGYASDDATYGAGLCLACVLCGSTLIAKYQYGGNEAQRGSVKVGVNALPVDLLRAGLIAIEVCLFAFSKNPERIDGILIVLRAVGSSMLSYAAALYYSVHIVVHLGVAEGEVREHGAPVPDVDHADADCAGGTSWDTARVQLLLAVANLFLFSHMFLHVHKKSRFDGSKKKVS